MKDSSQTGEHSTRAFEYTEFLKKDNSNLTADLKRLSQVNTLRGISPLIIEWAIIATAVTINYYFSHPLIYFLSIVLIARSQHALMVIIHEAAHYRLAQSRFLNEVISNYFAAFPVFFCTSGYRINHMKHHKFLNTQQDPDWIRKIHLSEWQYPKTKPQILKTALKIILTSWYKLSFLFYNFSGIGHKMTYNSSAGRWLLFQKIIFYSTAIVSLVQTGHGMDLLLYWVIPFFFVLPIIERVRSVSEHFGLTYADAYSQTRNILCSPFEAFLFGPHNIRYHLVHHRKRSNKPCCQIGLLMPIMTSARCSKSSILVAFGISVNKYFIAS